MSFESSLPFAAAVLLGIPATFCRPAAWPLLANFAVLQFRYHALGLGYDPRVFLVVDSMTCAAIALLIAKPWDVRGTPEIDGREVAIAALFIPASLTYWLASDPGLSYWIPWTVGVAQFVLVFPWELIGEVSELNSRRKAWGR